MNLHSENTKENYFAKKVESFAKESAAPIVRNERMSFMDLKIMEFWSRFMQNHLDGSCRTFCECYMPDKYKGVFADRIYNSRDLIDFSSACRTEIDGRCYNAKELMLAYHENRDDRFADGLFSMLAYYANEGALSRDILVQIIRECALEKISEGCDEADVSFQRTFELKHLFGLSDEAIELVLYLWLKGHKNMSLRLEIKFSNMKKYFDTDAKGSFERISCVTGLSSSTLYELCSKESALIKFRIVQMEQVDKGNESVPSRRELFLASDIVDFLHGFSDVSHIINYKPAEPPIVSYEQIAQQNSHAKFVLHLLQSHTKGSPLNILFYGREGTGKTELAKALAQKMNVPLISVGIGDESMNEETLLHHRLRSLLLAEWECEKSGGIILIDEADLVLNSAEKGHLNILFENLKVPVIWITNSIKSIENSTRRRFDYSIEFSTFGKQERIAIWKSVLKVQNAESMIDAATIEKIATEIPVMAGSATLAVQAAKRLANNACDERVNLEPQQIIREVANSHAKLLDIKVEKNVSYAKNQFREDFIHFSCGFDDPLRYAIPLLQNFDVMLRQRKESGQRENLNMLLYGPPGTGKTAFANYIAHDILHRDIIVKRASDILGSLIGETEKAIRDIFMVAEQNDAILFIDEADSFLENRDGAQHRWEISQVNEFICQMDSFNGLFIAATNYERSLDKAIRRRFQFKLGFDYLETSQVKKIWKEFFGGNCPKVIFEQDEVSISDFAAVSQKLRYMPDNLKTSELIAEYMLDEITNKDDHYGRRLGL